MQNLIDPTLAENMTDVASEKQVDVLFTYMEEKGQTFYDEVVTQLEHALQCAALAEKNNASATVITGALLHDIGHFVLDEHNADIAFLDIDLNHEEVGAEYMSPFFPDAVITPIRLHVPAKRYLCTVDDSYHDGLSEASKKSLKVQGGVMSNEEKTAFEAIPHYKDALTLRRWDDLAKVKGMETQELETYRDIVQQCLNP
ncbi:HDIG domain-containing protein [Candidatus Poribacteria bacterium]|nr:HDIG domain-containing protein [Candidatus Poribacteria bacterium]